MYTYILYIVCLYTYYIYIYCGITAKHLVLPEALSKHCKKWVILAFLKSLGRGPVRRCTSHPEP